MNEAEKSFIDAIKTCPTASLEAWLKQYQRFVTLTEAELDRRAQAP